MKQGSEVSFSQLHEVDGLNMNLNSSETKTTLQKVIAVVRNIYITH
jgi:hypothetical protein